MCTLSWIIGSIWGTGQCVDGIIRLLCGLVEVRREVVNIDVRGEFYNDDGGIVFRKLYCAGKICVGKVTVLFVAEDRVRHSAKFTMKINFAKFIIL